MLGCTLISIIEFLAQYDLLLSAHFIYNIGFLS